MLRPRNGRKENILLPGDEAWGRTLRGGDIAYNDGGIESDDDWGGHLHRGKQDSKQ
jgi:hypothetical protein